MPGRVQQLPAGALWGGRARPAHDRRGRSARSTRSSAATSAPTRARRSPPRRCRSGRAAVFSSDRSSSARPPRPARPRSRLTLVARGLPEGHPTRNALGALETAAIAAELSLSAINERRLGPLARPLSEGRSGVRSARRSGPWPAGSPCAWRGRGPTGPPRTSRALRTCSAASPFAMPGGGGEGIRGRPGSGRGDRARHAHDGAPRGAPRRAHGVVGAAAGAAAGHPPGMGRGGSADEPGRGAAGQ